MADVTAIRRRELNVFETRPGKNTHDFAYVVSASNSINTGGS